MERFFKLYYQRRKIIHNINDKTNTMKNFKKAALTMAITTSIFIISCEPNNKNGSTDQNSSGNEGAIDSTKIPQADSSHASVHFSRFAVTTV